MDPPVAKKRGRPRKRRAEAKKQAVETGSIALLGRYVLKEFETSGIYLGKVVFYDSGLYRVHYEDGDCEDLESREIRGILVAESDFDAGLSGRRKRLDKFVAKVSVKKVKVEENVEKEVVVVVDRVESSEVSEWSGRVVIDNDEVREEDGDGELSSDSSECGRNVEAGGADVETPALLLPPPELPPSSGTIGVPERCVSCLFSVYGFMRSFSICLFLNPFSLDDFVGSLNYCGPNTLFDAIHVALLRALRRHLETISSEGSEVAQKCLRCTDWSLLDTLTWPVYLVQYLTIMGYVQGPEWKGFYDEVLDKEYYLLSVDRKLMILQIICDDVLDSRDIRAELDIREESEVGIDYDDEAASALVNGPRRVHPRYSKTSACKDREAMEISTGSHEVRLSGNLKSLSSKVAKGEHDATDVDLDRNSDDCRLCGMDGTLLCCDGCPSAYHTRCIGVMKLSIPEGSWFCPECAINKIGPTITVGTSVKGAQLFGIDSYEHIFLGTCNHLLVLKETINIEPCLRYYNQYDIPKVLKVLYSSGQNTSFYLRLCKEILEFWNIPESILSLPELAELKTNFADIKENEDFSSAQSLPFSGKDCNKVTDMGGDGKCEAYVNGDNLDKAVASFECHSDSTPQVQRHRSMEIDERNKMEYAVSIVSGTQQANPSNRSSVTRSTATDKSTCTPGIINSGNNVHANGIRFSVASQNQEGKCIGNVYSTSLDDCIYKGSLFKPHAYINYYVHGDFAASAAAKLAELSSEEARVPDVQASGNPRKVASLNNLWQSKAFSLVASRFFWPSFEKKLVEVPRERCGWCLSCQASVASKRGCMLNHACLSVTKGAMKILASLRPIKSGEGNLVSITTYILYMEESLHGLITGPFLNENYRKQLRQQVYQASTCKFIKVLLLKLEENIRNIALSGEWIKLVDDLLVESSAIQGPTCTAGTTQRRGSRRSRKQSAVQDVVDDDCNDKSFVWWQGGKLSKIIFQRAILPKSLVKRAARQGGSRKIFGVSYVDGPDIPKRSRQSVWRAAVELSKNGAQLAVQVRYLDYHIRWSDLVRPEQNLLDGKAAEAEASAFRNASICDKKMLKNNIVYGVAFGSQKHLPNRVMKNIIETEQTQDGTNKFWFLESRVPLYLIKEYEESVAKVPMAMTSAQEPNLVHKLQRRQRKATCRDIFLYLECKRDNLDLTTCSLCQLDLILQNAVKCSACQGHFHEGCTISSTVYTNEEVEFLITCRQCYHMKALAQKQKIKELPTTPLPVQRKEYHTPLTVRLKYQNQPIASIKIQQPRSEIKQATTDSGIVTKKRRPICSWGVIWKKKTPDTGTDFRTNNILLGGRSDVHKLKPVCHLCHRPYMSALTYICCEYCKNWFHAEAVELEDSKICDVVGFKCCKCRRIKSPHCPYTDSKDKTLQESKKIRIRRSKQENIGEDSDSATYLDSEVFEPATPVEEVAIQDDDPLLFALSRVELVTDHTSEVNAEWDTAGPGPRKLPVRRQVKREEDLDTYGQSNISHAERNMHEETNYVSEPMEIASFPHVEWDASMNGVNDEMMGEYEDLNYDLMQPQTVFTINELLAPDDGDLFDGVETFVNSPGNLENPYSTSQHVGPGQYDVAAFTDGPNSAFSDTYVNMQCQICLHAEPAPDLSCQNCGLLIHNHCSPWIESSQNDSWKCGQCREWK
ncbi:DDT domain-containing protein PTM-like [Argentina anserina]|uniref:DDT domain-containing protein PTM-like n=1 Tax=Argentina anserina TaxID=57926 RepID=UPI00217652E4|nr:DDT domain-containing protein PTM-like [Potentilla anserina]XP_050368094.1 DDT domain-containing protein PTM-like [Potentilla anserina]